MPETKPAPEGNRPQAGQLPSNQPGQPTQLPAPPQPTQMPYPPQGMGGPSVSQPMYTPGMALSQKIDTAIQFHEDRLKALKEVKRDLQDKPEVDKLLKAVQHAGIY
jgi:hypothetical protein